MKAPNKLFEAQHNVSVLQRHTANYREIIDQIGNGHIGRLSS